MLQNATLHQLRLFAAVIEHGGFTAAAKALHLTQPAVSMQVKELEEACGLPLFEKLGRRVDLTEAGRELATCVAGITAQLRETQEHLDALRGLKKGTLKLGAVSTAKYFAPALLAEFQRLYPDTSVRLVVSNREDIVRHLENNEVDLVLMGRPPKEVATDATSFAKHPLIIIAAPDHPLAQRRRIRLATVAQENFLLREPGSGTRAAMEALFASRNLAFKASMEMSSNETIKQAVMAGMGLAFISSHTVGLELTARRLVALDVVGLPVMKSWFVLCLAKKRPPPIAAAFRQFLLERGPELLARTAGGS